MPTPGPFLIGWSEAFHQAFSLSHRFARIPRPILLLGPSGVGKGLFAKLIHSVSGVPGAFISVTGGELADSLYHSQLFGHEPGAFTGAVRQKRGAFEQAQGGTLFLDELPLWTPAAQSAVLRALSDGVVRRLGAEREFDLNCRIVVASTTSPDALVMSGRLLPDLRWRLGEFVIRIPPLRERREDILPLAEHYRARAVAEFGQARPTFFSREAVRRLVSYDWPGDDPDAAPNRSRAQIYVDPSRASATTYTVTGSCFLGKCYPPSASNRVYSRTPADGNGVTVTFHLKDSAALLGAAPDLDGVIFIKPDGKGGVTTSGNVSAYPSSDIYQMQGGNWVPIRSPHDETDPLDLFDEGARHRW